MAARRSPLPTMRSAWWRGRAADGGTNSSFAMTVSIAVEFLGRRQDRPAARGARRAVAGDGAASPFARGSVTQEGPHHRLVVGRVPATWRRAKAMARKDEAAPALSQAAPQTVPADFELLAQCQRLFPAHRPVLRAQGGRTAASLIQPTLPHMCNSGGVLHGGYMMSFCRFGGHPPPRASSPAWRPAR